MFYTRENVKEKACSLSLKRLGEKFYINPIGHGLFTIDTSPKIDCELMYEDGRMYFCFID